MAITLVIYKQYTYCKIKFAQLLLNNKLAQVYKNFQRGITLPIFGVL